MGGIHGVDLQTVKLASGIIGLSSALAVHRLYGWGCKLVRGLLSKGRGYPEKGKRQSKRITGKGREPIKRDD